MKRILSIVMILVLLLSGCTIKGFRNDTRRPVVYGYDEDVIVLKKEINNDLYVMIECVDYKNEGDVNVTLYKNNEIVAKDSQEGIMKTNASISYEYDKKEITIVEDVTYYEENDKNNNFTYDSVTKLYINTKAGIGKCTLDSYQETSWNIVKNIRSIVDSSKYGVYNTNDFLYIYMFMMVILDALGIFMVINWLKKNPIIKDNREAKENILDVLMGICLMSLFIDFLLAVDLSYITLTILFILLVSRYILLVQRKNRIEKI